MLQYDIMVDDLEDDYDVIPKRVKMRDLKSILQSEGIGTYEPATSKLCDTEEHMDIIGTQGSQIVDNNAELMEVPPHKSSTFCRSKSLDLNIDLCTDENSGYNDIVSLGDSKKQVDEFDRNSVGSSSFDHNVQKVTTSSANFDLFTYRSQSNLKKEDGLRKWQGVKQNGFMSPSYGGIPLPEPAMPPKRRGRKRKNEELERKMEQAKKEQVDKFAKIAAPSGLLNRLNPGIINHVRNSKQVHSIIQALVRSEKQEILNQSSAMKVASVDVPHDTMGLENEGRRFYPHTALASPSNDYSHDDRLALKLATPSMVSEGTISLPNVDTLSVKAATVASQWLQLLHHDINGRLSALQQSKKRVCAAITTELPLLLSKEFKSSPETDSSMKSVAELHQAQWNKLFIQMDRSLSEEETDLKCWLKEVNQMLQLCDQGLHVAQLNMASKMQPLPGFKNNLRSKVNDPEKELSVRAAAACIYSTGNYASLVP